MYALLGILFGRELIDGDRLAAVTRPRQEHARVDPHRQPPQGERVVVKADRKAVAQRESFLRGRVALSVGALHG